jgi:hypothetical protein
MLLAGRWLVRGWSGARCRRRLVLLAWPPASPVAAWDRLPAVLRVLPFLQTPRRWHPRPQVCEGVPIQWLESWHGQDCIGCRHLLRDCSTRGSTQEWRGICPMMFCYHDVAVAGLTELRTHTALSSAAGDPDLAVKAKRFGLFPGSTTHVTIQLVRPACRCMWHGGMQPWGQSNQAG